MTTNPFDILSTLDFVIFFAILLVTIAVVIFGKTKRSGEDDSSENSTLEVLLDGRRLTLPLFIATLVSTWYGGIFGVTQIAYEHGIYNFITQGFFWYISYLVFAFFLSSKLRRTEVKTLPELAGNLFGQKSQKIASIFNLVNVIPIAYALSLGIFIDTLFGLGILTSTLIGTGAVVFYSCFGGFRAIVLSDLVQFFVMVSSVALIFFFSYSTFGGLDYLKANLPSTHFEITGGQPVSNLVVWGLIAMSTLVDPNFYQRVFAAKNEKVAKRGILGATVVWCIFDVCTTAGAMYAAAHLKDVDSAGAYLSYGLQILPDGFRGFFLAGILATILSTLDSYIFVASTTVVYDMLKKRGKILFAHQLTTVAIGMMAALLTVVFSGGIRDIWKTLGSYSAGCLLLPMLIGLWGRYKISDNQFAMSTVIGAVAITIWRFYPLEGFWANVDDLYAGIFFTGLALFVSHFTRLRSATT